jgi:superoxide reductase
MGKHVNPITFNLRQPAAGAPARLECNLPPVAFLILEDTLFYAINFALQKQGSIFGGEIMDRRTFLKTTAIGTVTGSMFAGVAAAERYFPTKVNQSLFENINRAKDPTQKTPLEKGHVPVLKAPASVKAGEPFIVEVSVGETVHPMGPAHWIEYIELNIGNEPAGRIDFQPKGYLKPKASFTVVLSAEAAPSGKVALVARQQCNMHGLWEGSLDITVA